MAYNSNKGPQHTGDLQYEGDPNDVQIDFENDEIALKTGGVQRVVLTNAELSSSGIFRSVGSLSGSGDIAVSGAMHAANFYGVGAGISGVTATAVSGTTAQLTTGVETSGYLKVTGSSTLSALTVTTLSASGATHTDGVTTIGNTLATTGSITAGTTVTATTTLLGNTLDIGGSDFIVTANGVVSGSGRLTCTSLSASGESHFSGNVGIGTANPNYDLHVNGAGATVVAIDGGASADAYLKFATNGTEKAHIKQGSGGNTIITNDVAGKNLQLQARPSAGAASTYIFLDGASESVLVAKPVSASNTLHHVGAATFGSTIAATGSLTATGLYSTDLISGSLGMHVDAPATFGATVAVTGSVTAASFSGSGTVSGSTFYVENKIIHTGDTDTYINFTTDDINITAGGVNFVDFTSGSQHDVTFNEAGVDIDFRVETADESHMLFIEGSSNRMSIGDNTGTPGATVEIKNHASVGATGVPLLQLNNNDTDQQCLDINAGNIDANVVNITANDVTTARVLAIGADGLTTGNALYVDDNSSNTGTRNTALIIQNDAAAINAKALAVQSDGGKTGVKIDKNYSDLTEASIVGLDIDWDKTGASTSDNTMYGIQLDMDNTTATNGTNYMYGLHVTPTLTHAANAGSTFVYGALINAQGGSNGTSFVQGARIEAGGGDINYGLQLDVEDGGVDLRIESSADNGDYFQIQTTTAGATTITTVDDGGAAAHLTFNVDGDITLDPVGNNVIVDGNVSGSGTLYGAGAATFSSTIAATGSVTAVGLYSTELISGSLGLHVDQPASFGDIVTVTASVGVGIAAPKTALDVHHDPTTLDNDTGGGEVVKFGTGTLTAGKMYYLHSGSSWEQTDMILAESGATSMLGIAMGSSPTADGLLVRGFYDVNSYFSGAFVVGQPVYISAPGYLTTMRPSGSAEVVRRVGHCTTTANVVYFNPSLEYIELV
jgi:hypothetical protein